MEEGEYDMGLRQMNIDLWGAVDVPNQIGRWVTKIADVVFKFEYVEEIFDVEL